jgi:putative DNA primase/helicase
MSNDFIPLPEMDAKTDRMQQEAFKKWLKTDPLKTVRTVKKNLPLPEEENPGTYNLMLSDQEIKVTENLKLTDAGIAEAFNELYGEDFRFMQEPADAYKTVTKGIWMFYDTCKWKTIAEAEIRSLVLGIIRVKEIFLLSRMAESEEQSKARRKMLDRCLSYEQDVKQFGVLNQIKTQTHILSSLFDQDDMLLGCINAVIDLKKGLKKSSISENGQPTKNYIFKSTSVEYDPMAECPRWIKFLDEIFLDNKELVDYIQMVVGYVLTGSQKEQCFFILYGDGENGKSTFLEIILQIMGDYGQSAEFKTFCEKREEYISNEVWRMQGKRFVRAVEVKESAPLNIARLKSMTGSDTMTARGLFRESEDFQFKAKVFLGVNHPPLITEMDRAIERRIHFIPFKANFPKGSPTRDDQLLEKLMNEKSGILNWAIMGCLKYQWACEKFGSLPIPEVVRLETSEYVLTQDQVRRFLGEMTEMKPDSEASAKELYEVFSQWCLHRNEHLLGQNTFGRRLRSIGYDKKAKSKGIFYQNLHIKALINMNE